MFRPLQPSTSMAHQELPKYEKPLNNMSKHMYNITQDLEEYSDSSSCLHKDRHASIAKLIAVLKVHLDIANNPKEEPERRIKAFSDARETLKQEFELLFPGIPFDNIRKTEKNWGYGNEKIKALFQKCKLNEEKFQTEMFSANLWLSDSKLKASHPAKSATPALKP